ERIKDRVARRIGALHVGNLQRQQSVVDDRHYTGSQVNTSPDRSSGVSDCLKAPLSCASSFSGVQPSERCSTRIGRGCENRKISLFRMPMICPVMPSALSAQR